MQSPNYNIIYSFFSKSKSSMILGGTHPHFMTNLIIYGKMKAMNFAYAYCISSFFVIFASNSK
jgi:hypothetical protein